MANPAMALWVLAQIAFPRGRVVDTVRGQADTAERYALYLPARYDTTRHWPFLFVMDPRGRATRALARFKDGAERDGYVVLSSYNTVSDSTEAPNIEALNAALKDATTWFAIDQRRIYLAGFSGTARLAWGYGIQLRGHVAGLLGFGAGLPWSGTLAYIRLHDSIGFVFFGGAGFLDFNYNEVRRLEGQLDTLATIPHHFEYYDSPHAWPPAPIGAQAIDWMTLQAMKVGLTARRDSAIAVWYDSALARARETADPWEARRGYQAAIEDFRGIHDVTVATAAADSLGRLKAVRQEDDRRRELAKAAERYETETLPRYAREVDSAKTVPSLERSLHMLDLGELTRHAKDTTDRLGATAARRLITDVFVNVAFYMPRAYLAKGDTARALAVLGVAETIDSTDADVKAMLARARGH
jgi:predicted esterase